MRSLTKANHRSFDETVKRDGRILSVAPRTVSADEKTMPVRRTRCKARTFTEIKQQERARR